MVKSYQQNLKGKMKVKRKPHPTGDKFKKMSDGRSQIVTHIKLCKCK